MPWLIVRDLALDGHLVKRCSAKGLPQAKARVEADYGVSLLDDGRIMHVQRGPLSGGPAITYCGSWELADAPPPRLKFADGVADAPDGRIYRVIAFDGKLRRDGRRGWHRMEVVHPDGRVGLLADSQGSVALGSRPAAEKACQAHLDTGHGEVDPAQADERMARFLGPVRR